uniref:MLA13uORF 1 n=1 Tax=Hordeum vulgare TaxID=4513 RepID=Q8GS32_HORVU|nr:MLA13uORF 1 [Hordeum vulgare]AAO16006.1 MLA13uORF 1 [Hordeum vulgare]AAO16009.1 MLA13uORF 1 [Hordeum vulgare]AAO16012.1 MLA13uORF 1 [Hordeum vulgare]AAO16015.1 MLA13uORF 1 [Hordeum vulgare]
MPVAFSRLSHWHLTFCLSR